jgi:5'-nucleotidase / UDP-sugar diphosphatase
MIKKSLFTVLSSLLVVGGLGGVGNTESASAQEAASKTITLLHTNDSHSKVEESQYEGMGFAKLATLMEQYEKQNENTLILDAGDTFHGSPFATTSKGESIAQLFNALGYDALAAGNHDFNYGYQRLLELTGLVDFPILSANVRHEADDTRLLDPYIIEEVDGVKVGIFGLTTPETTYKTNPKNVEGLTFTDPVEEAQAMVAELQSQDVDVIVALTHLGTDASSTETSIKVAEGAPGIDVIVDGHSHTTNLEKHGDNTLIVSAGEYTENLGVVQLKIDSSNNLIGTDADLITKEEAAEMEITEDTDIRALIDSINEKNDEILSEVIGSTNVKLDGEREQVRGGETNLGNIITDSMVSATGAEAAITNGGGIRASIQAGEITKGDVVNVLPFGNFVVTKKFSGAVIKEALEHGTSDYPNVKGAFPHVSGMTYEIDLHAEAGDRVKNIKIKGEPVDLEKEYLIATNDFMAVGGDDYTMFTDGELVNEFSALDEILINYINENSPVEPKVENRISLYTPFTDLGWEKEFVADLYSKGIINGVSATDFAPKQTLTRSQFASLIVRSLGLEATETTPFTDINHLRFDIEAEIAAAYEAGIIQGKTETTFEPNTPVKRFEMTLMLKRAYEYVTGEEYAAESDSPFTDLAKLPEEGQASVDMAYELGLVVGYGDKFKPAHSATRAEAAKVVSLFLTSVE